MMTPEPGGPGKPPIASEFSEPQEWDLVVIGAGVAGALLAGLTARKGLKVLIVEKEPWPRAKVCGSCLNPRGWAVLTRSGAASFLKPNETIALDTMCLWGSTHRAQYALPQGRVVARHTLDAALVEWAKEGGARFSPQTVALPKSGSLESPLSLSLDHLGTKRVVQTRCVVGAWGLSSWGGRMDSSLASTVREGSRLGLGTILPPVPGATLKPGRLLMVVRDGGYVGVVRLADDSIDMAAAIDSQSLKETKSPGKLVANWLAQIDPALARAAEQAEWKGTPPLTRTSRTIHQGGVFLVGDACGYVEPFTGEGMTWALVGAESLASLLVQAHESNFSPEALTHAGNEWGRFYRRLVVSRQGVCKTLARGLRHPRITDLAIGALEWFPQLGTVVAGWLAKK